MQELIPLHLPPAPLKLQRQADQKLLVQCLIRRKFLILTPEEWVRQHLIAYLHLNQGFALEKISVEKQIRFDGFTKRWDIVVFDNAFQPLMLIECKAPQIALNDSVLRQVAVYQRKIQAPFIALSNGIAHLIYKLDAKFGTIEQCEDFPLAPNFEKN
ncbi:MAG: type I restriction enzyme HsdR N-terminal domain-containing protein [Flavobacteriales bacterium]